MERYSVIHNKNNREIVLLKGFPCVWGKCAFCDYITDNSDDVEEINNINFNILDKVTGKYGVLEVINSGSCFELPKETLEKIKNIVKEKNIKKLFFESHWCYRKRLKQMREFFNIPIIFKIGIETFDDFFRNEVLNKNTKFENYEDVLKEFKSVCLLIGIKGQTKEMIKKDIAIVEENFPFATINIFTENSTSLKRDEELIKWFLKEYNYLEEKNNIEVLYENTDFGVGD
ncbi:radical SAM protein [Hathewaya histolytica]|uniref:radical SAM protein n=1 Tax=Hathewaya histolytica TaxID=1498 RepID=UPI003B66BB7E